MYISYPYNLSEEKLIILGLLIDIVKRVDNLN